MHKKRGFTPLEIRISNRGSKRFLTGPIRSRRLTSNGAGFTLIELLVVVSIIALLMAILFPALNRARDQAKNAACMANLHQWAIMFDMYAGNNDAKTVAGFYRYGARGNPAKCGKCIPTDSDLCEHMWIVLLQPYYENMDMCKCPAALRTWEDGIFEGPLVGWSFKWLQEEAGEEYFCYYGPPTIPEHAYGSYGKNSFCSSEMDPGMWYDAAEKAWETVNVRGGNKIPLLLDCQFIGGFPDPHDEPPEWPDYWFMTFDGEMQRYCIDRHNLSINSLFLDCSVRKVGLKQLWQLKWSREMGWGDPGIVPDPEYPEEWPEWMRRSKNYD